MRFARLAIPTIAITIVMLAAAVIACGPAVGPTGFEPTSDPSALSPRAEPRPAPTNTPPSELTPTPEPAVDPSTSPISAGHEPSLLRENPFRLSDSPTATPPAGAGTGPSAPDAEQGPVYTYQDGDRTIRVVLQDDLAVQKTADNTSDDVVILKGIHDSIVRRQVKHGSDAPPVFRAETGGGLMTLPGGVLLALDPDWDQTAVDDFFSQNDIATDRVSELGFLENGFFIESEPGFESLELANALAAQPGAVISSPNWQTQVEAK